MCMLNNVSVISNDTEKNWFTNGIITINYNSIDKANAFVKFSPGGFSGNYYDRKLLVSKNFDHCYDKAQIDHAGGEL